MAATKSDPTTTKSIPKTDVVTPSDEELAAKLIEDSFPNLASSEAKPELTPTPKVEVAIVPQPLPEPEIINDFFSHGNILIHDGWRIRAILTKSMNIRIFINWF